MAFGNVSVGLRVSHYVPITASAPARVRAGLRVANSVQPGTITARAGVAMPGPHVPFIDKRTGSVSADWRRYFADLDRRLGGVLGPAIGAVLASAQSAEAAAVAASVAANTAQVRSLASESAVRVIKEVAQLNALSGADQIPTQEP